MLDFILTPVRSLLSGCQCHSQLVLENLALRHQLGVLKRQPRKPRLHPADRLLWVCWLRFWPHWQQALLLFQPQTLRLFEGTLRLKPENRPARECFDRVHDWKNRKR